MTTEQAAEAASPTEMNNRRRTVLIVLLASQFLMAADFSILNVALPRVGVDLGFNTGDLQWITTTFALCAAGLVLLGIGVGQILGGAIGPRLVEKIPAHTLLGLALAGQGAFMLPMLLMPPTTAWIIPLVATQFVNAVFSMLAMLAFMVIATSAVDTDMQGMATGLATQSQQVGIAIGIPVMSAVFTAVIGAEAVGSEQLPGIRTAVAVDGLLLVAVGLLLWLVLRRPETSRAEPVPARSR
jgi:MFS family permease